MVRDCMVCVLCDVVQSGFKCSCCKVPSNSSAVPCGTQIRVSGASAPVIKVAVIGTKESSSLGPRRLMAGGVLVTMPTLLFRLPSQ